jgi:hypothetical protein
VCFTDDRFGGPHRYQSFGDGPKFICGIDYLRATTTMSSQAATRTESSSCLVYSVGSSNEIHFEMAVKDLLPACEAHTFDPTLTAAYIGDEYSTFHPWGLGADNVTSLVGGIQFVTQSVLSIYRALGHEGRRIDILKVDCEGCEYESMGSLFDAIAKEKIQVDQLLVELHITNSPEKYWKILLDFFAAADRAKMRIFHKERNHWGCDGYYCLEYAFVSEDFLRRANADIVCGRGTTSS